MEVGIKLAQWFKAEDRRVYGILAESDEDHDQRRLIEWIERKGGWVRVPEVQRYMRFDSAEEARAALDSLVKAGDVICRDVPPGPKGGPPTREFRLSTLPAADTTT